MLRLEPTPAFALTDGFGVDGLGVPNLAIWKGDRVAAFGGSWPFIIAFGVFLAGWTVLNLLLSKEAFDPYPFIFLNLVLSMLTGTKRPLSEQDRP